MMAAFSNVIIYLLTLFFFIFSAKLTVQEQKLEGEFRYVNSRLITNSEEIAFYQVSTQSDMKSLAVLLGLVPLPFRGNFII